MAYVAPSQRAVGFLVTASVWNQDVGQNIIFLHDPPACRAFHSTSQSVSNAAYTALALNSERFDNASMHDAVTNNSRITAPVAGVYLISGHCAGTFPQGSYFADIRQNGSGGVVAARKQQRQSSASNTFQAISLLALLKLAVNDYVELMFQPNRDDLTGSVTIDSATAYTPELAAEWIGAGV